MAVAVSPTSRSGGRNRGSCSIGEPSATPRNIITIGSTVP